jgi:hypothetical protein
MTPRPDRLADRAYWAILLFFIALALLSVAAFAQPYPPPGAVVVTATEPASALSVALSNALIAFLAIAVPVVGSFLTLALNRLRQKWDAEATVKTLEAKAQNTANLNSDVHTSIAAGIAQSFAEIKAAGWNSTPVQTNILTRSAEYMQDHFPDRVAEIVGQVPTVGPATVLKDVLAARLPDAVAIAAASPATPPVTSAHA